MERDWFSECQVNSKTSDIEYDENRHVIKCSMFDKVVDDDLYANVDITPDPTGKTTGDVNDR